MPSLCTFWMMSKISCTSSGERPMEGSSSISMDALLISARPIASICCSPPDMVPASCLRRSFRRGNSSNTFSLLGAMVEAGWVYAPMSRFSSTVMCRNT